MDYKQIHPWNVSPKEAQEIQQRLLDRLRFGKLYKKLNTVAGADVAFLGSKAYGSVAVLSMPELELKEKVGLSSRVDFPYIPGLLAFREGPLLLQCLAKLKTAPDAIIFDGQGIAHPRKMGMASHLGILLCLPTIGCAKSRLYGTCDPPENIKGAYSWLKDERGEIIGACLRTRKGVKPVYVSPGYGIDLQSSIEVIMASVAKYRIPEPLRAAHQLSLRAAKELEG